MQDVGGVRGLERFGNLPANPDHVVGRERPTADVLGQRRPLDQLEHERLDATFFGQSIDGADAGMAERGQQPRFAAEPREPRRILGESRRQHLDGHVAVQPGVAGPKHFAHASATDRRDDFVVLDPIAGTKPSRVGLPGALELLRQLIGQRPGERFTRREESARVQSFGQHDFDGSTKIGIVRGRSRDEPGALAGWELERTVEDLVGVGPAAQVDHGVSFSPASAARSHARALNHSRCAVRTDTPRAAAVSSSVRPAKYRHSTTLACR